MPPSYPLTGTAAAELEARLANFRLAQTRLGYMNPTLRLTVGGTEQSTRIRKGSLRVAWNLNAPSTATFTCADFTPIEGQEVIIGIGTITNRLFGGHITRVTQNHQGLQSNKTFSVSCQDYTWILNKKQVLRSYASDNVESIIADLFSNFGTGFTTNHVQQGLKFLTGGMPFTMETPSGCLYRLAEDANAVTYIDPYKDLHFFSTDRIPQPHDLTSSYKDYENVSLSTDLSQICTRVYVEGAGTTFTVQYTLGSQLFVADTSLFPSTPAYPSSPSFSVRMGNYAPIGNRLFQVQVFDGTTLQKTAESNDETFGPLVADDTWKIGELVNMWLTSDDTAAQTALAALEGGDGIHEAYIQDRRLSYDGMVTKAAGKLAKDKDPIDTLTYRTHDPNTRPGASVTVNLPAPASITGTFQIQSVVITDIEMAYNRHPWYQVTATAKQRTLWDVYQAALQAGTLKV